MELVTGHPQLHGHRDGAFAAVDRVIPRLRDWCVGAAAVRAMTVGVDGLVAVLSLLLLGLGGTRPSLSLLALVAGGWLLLLRACGGYRTGLAGVPIGATKPIALAGLVGALAVAALAPSAGLVLERPALALAAPALFLLGRLATGAVRLLLRRSGRHRQPVLIVGHGPDAHELLANLAAWPCPDVETVGVCADTKDASIGGVPVLGPARSCALIARELGVKSVIVAPGELSGGACARESQLSRAGLEVVLVPAALNIDAARISLHQLGGLPLLSVGKQASSAREGAKRVFDVVLAGFLLVLLAPLLALIALLVRRDSPGPAVFRQRRVGRNGATFELWKFRTMRVDAEALLADLQALEPNVHAPGLFKLPDDPRVTRLGRRLRRTSLDELPQLWNVLKGEMSLVGPRPALPQEVAEFDDFTLRRLRTKPGITGLWQTSGRSDASFATYSRMDAFYADNWTALGDLKILLRTVPAVLSARGAY